MIVFVILQAGAQQIRQVCINKMKSNTYHAVGTIPNSNRKVMEIDNHNTQIHDRPHSWLATVTSIKVAWLS
jgi:hypothetical protein